MIEEINIEFPEGIINVFVKITNDDGSYTSMLKSVYEEKWGPIENE